MRCVNTVQVKTTDYSVIDASAGGQAVALQRPEIKMPHMGISYEDNWAKRQNAVRPLLQLDDLLYRG